MRGAGGDGRGDDRGNGLRRGGSRSNLSIWVARLVLNLPQNRKICEFSLPGFFVFSQSFPISFFVFFFLGGGCSRGGFAFSGGVSFLSCVLFVLFSFWSGIFSSRLSFVSLVVVGEGGKKSVFCSVVACLLAWSLCLCFLFSYLLSSFSLRNFDNLDSEEIWRLGSLRQFD